MSQTQLETACETIINIFHQYSARVGHFDTLSKKEMAELLKKELPNFLKGHLAKLQCAHWPPKIGEPCPQILPLKCPGMGVGILMWWGQHHNACSHPFFAMFLFQQQDKKNPKAIDEVFNDLDKNKDAQLSFGEFTTLISRVLIASHEHIHEEGHEGHSTPITKPQE
ncbi:protein S100-A12-like [Elgaria multicarinata webbii]|uniref:protein S100-A12-like n=1 Tax=Elgaria multicarinata webbii TaxID=159646 RepID=UPI002FCCC74E